VQLVHLDGFKDVSALHVDAPERFLERLQAALDAAEARSEIAVAKASRELARRIFVRLAELGEGTEDTRCRAAAGARGGLRAASCSDLGSGTDSGGRSRLTEWIYGLVGTTVPGI
jgi:hypothetical protein